jgi:Zn-dependent protease with chaperone function
VTATVTTSKLRSSFIFLLYNVLVLVLLAYSVLRYAESFASNVVQNAFQVLSEFSASALSAALSSFFA